MADSLTPRSSMETQAVPGLSLPFSSEAEQSVLGAVLLDSSKIGLKSTFHICELSEVDIIISDGKLPVEFLQACRNAGVTVL